MSAINPLPVSDPSLGASEKRSYEPSMEEILASIRRIIADDQSLPKHPSIDPGSVMAGPEADGGAVSTPQEPAPFPDLQPAATPARTIAADVGRVPSPEAAYEAPAVSSAGPEVSSGPGAAPTSLQDAELSRIHHDAFAAYEPVAAPQFPAPHGPVGDEAASVPTASGLAAASSQAYDAATSAEQEPEPAAMAPSPIHELRPPPVAASAASFDRDDASDEMPIEPPRRPQPHLFSEETDTSVSSAFNLLAASRLADNSDELLTLAREMIKPLLRTWLDDNLPSMVERMVRAEIERVARGGR